ncbi:MAG: DNA-binding transcriptional MerR regulator [Cocleimonas sp.]|jgi:DNA-binding transcriptional MerR regulator
MKNLDPIIPVSDEGLYPIRTVSEVSGVNSITLRAWERRYGLFKPKRTPKGHRLYSDKDIQRIHQVLELLAKGVSIGRVAKALKNDKTSNNFSNLTTTKTDPVSAKHLTKHQWEGYQQDFLKKINTYDVLQLEIFLHELFSHHDFDVVSNNLMRPVLVLLRNRANQLQSLSGDYHFYKVFLTHRIGGFFLNLSIRNSGKKIILMGIDESQSEIELLLFSMTLLNHGYQVVNLGCDVAFDAMPMTLNSSDADALLLYTADDNTNKITTNSFKTLVSSINQPVFTTGSYSEHQLKGMTESGLFILPKNRKKQIEMIDKKLNKISS